MKLLISKTFHKVNSALTLYTNALLAALIYFLGIGTSSIIAIIFPNARKKPTSNWHHQKQDVDLNKMY